MEFQASFRTKGIEIRGAVGRESSHWGVGRLSGDRERDRLGQKFADAEGDPKCRNGQL